MAERAGLAFTSYESVAITLPVSADAIKAKDLIEKAEANYLIFNSMKAKVSLEPIIR